MPTTVFPREIYRSKEGVWVDTDVQWLTVMNPSALARACELFVATGNPVVYLNNFYKFVF